MKVVAGCLLGFFVVSFGDGVELLELIEKGVVVHFVFFHFATYFAIDYFFNS